jgi:hypothetical protein
MSSASRLKQTLNPSTCQDVSTHEVVFLKIVLDFATVSTDTYRAQYHVLEAFSLFNVILSASTFSINLPLPTYVCYSMGIPVTVIGPRAENASTGEEERVV